MASYGSPPISPATATTVGIGNLILEVKPPIFKKATSPFIDLAFELQGTWAPGFTSYAPGGVPVDINVDVYYESFGEITGGPPGWKDEDKLLSAPAFQNTNAALFTVVGNTVTYKMPTQPIPANKLEPGTYKLSAVVTIPLGFIPDPLLAVVEGNVIRVTV